MGHVARQDGKPLPPSPRGAAARPESGALMDPDANLREQRTLVKRLLKDDEPVSSEDAIRLADLVESLDAWIVKGGSYPECWHRMRRM